MQLKHSVNKEKFMTKLTMLALAVIAAIVLLLTVWQKAYADDGFVVRGTVSKSMDTATDYYEYTKKDGVQQLRGLGTVQVGYSVTLSSVEPYIKSEAGVFHTSSPFTPEDYGMNGLYGSLCYGNGC